MSSKFGQIRPWTAEFAALERLKKSIMSTLQHLHFWSDLLHFASNEDNRIISDEYGNRPDCTKECGVSCPLDSGKNP